MTGDQRVAFKRRTTEAFLRVALQTALVRIGQLSYGRAEEALNHFEHSLVRGLRTLPSPKGVELATMSAAEDAITILRETVDYASRKIAGSTQPSVKVAVAA